MTDTDRAYISHLEAVVEAVNKADRIRAKAGGDHNLFWTEGWMAIHRAMAALDAFCERREGK